MKIYREFSSFPSDAVTAQRSEAEVDQGSFIVLTIPQSLRNFRYHMMSLR